MTFEFKHPSFYKKLKQQIKTELKNKHNTKTINNSNSTSTPKNNTNSNKLVKN